MVSDKPTGKLLTAKAIAEMLSLSKRTIARLNASRKMPAPVRIGGSVRWVESEILAWIQANTPDRKTWNSMKAGE